MAIIYFLEMFKYYFFKDRRDHLESQRGIALFMALVVVSVLLLLTFSVSNITFRELVISSTVQESQIAFYAAESGIECALWNNKYFAFSGSDDAPTPQCGGEEQFARDPADNNFWEIDYSLNGSCSVVRVEVQDDDWGELDEVKTIISDGYSDCISRTVQRTEAVFFE